MKYSYEFLKILTKFNKKGFLSYGFEICKYLKKDNWTRKWSKEHQVPFAYKSNQWVGYDDEASIKIKVIYLNT